MVKNVEKQSAKKMRKGSLEPLGESTIRTVECTPYFNEATKQYQMQVEMARTVQNTTEQLLKNGIKLASIGKY